MIASQTPSRTTSGRAESADESLHEFPPFRIDFRNEQFWNGERAVRLRPKTWAVLRYLVERPGVLVRKSDLHQDVWKDAFVTDDTLAKSISELRRAFDDDLREPRYIETVHRRGFRFLGRAADSGEAALAT